MFFEALEFFYMKTYAYIMAIICKTQKTSDSTTEIAARKDISFEYPFH